VTENAPVHVGDLVHVEPGEAPRAIDQRPGWDSVEISYGESPIHRVLGLTLSIRGEGDVVVHYDGSGGALNRRDVVAGGALSTMIDSAVVQACRTTLNPRDAVSTLELKVSFVGPGRGTLNTSARLEHVGKSTCVGYARTEDAAGRLVAVGIVSVAIRRSSPISDVPHTSSAAENRRK
jgi:uncharacterized protein (TIGR00369 family)